MRPAYIVSMLGFLAAVLGVMAWNTFFRDSEPHTQAQAVTAPKPPNSTLDQMTSSLTSESSKAQTPGLKKSEFTVLEDADASSDALFGALDALRKLPDPSALSALEACLLRTQDPLVLRTGLTALSALAPLLSPSEKIQVSSTLASLYNRFAQGQDRMQRGHRMTLLQTFKAFPSEAAQEFLQKLLLKERSDDLITYLIVDALPVPPSKETAEALQALRQSLAQQAPAADSLSQETRRELLQKIDQLLGATL